MWTGRDIKLNSAKKRFKGDMANTNISANALKISLAISDIALSRKWRETKKCARRRCVRLPLSNFEPSG